MKKSKGQILEQVLIWGAGLVATGAFAFTGFVNNKTTNLEEKNTLVVQRIAVVETENKQFRKDIDEIKGLLKEINQKIK